MAKSKGILEKAKEGIESLGEKGGQAMKSMTGSEEHKKSRAHNTRGRKSTKKARK